ncbi:Trp biosynthesis-associated membrane protein [Nocardioides sp. BGMRC 2183]|nr:Trp biosynthesis-associated membrane protein [Nocardioides sp. BGMRC 2183]
MAEAAPAQTPRSRRRTFGPVVLVGLAGSGLAAVGGHRAMLEVPGEYWSSIGSTMFAGEAYADINRVEFPLAGALALVSLACWGVVLVARGRFRRLVAMVAALASFGIVAVVLVGGFIQDEDAAGDIAERIGASGLSTIDLDPTVWLWATLAGGLLGLVAAAAAVAWAPQWPEMGSRYDAPTGAAGASASAAEPVEERSHLDVWKSLDEGQDPTA